MQNVQTLKVSGMTCASCVRHVEKALRAAPGVENVTVNLATETARVTTAPGTQASTLVTAIRKAGYGVDEALPPRAEPSWKFWKR